MNKILTGAIGLAIVIGGWSLFKNNTPPLTSLPTSEASSIKATAVLNPEQPMAGEATEMTFSFTNADGTPVSDLVPQHARRVHVLLVSEDLDSIGHIHPEDFDELTDEIVQSGVYSVNYTFPKAGKYIVGVDVMNMEDKLAQQFVVNVKGDGKMSKVTADLRREKCFRGYQEAGHDRYVNPVFVSEAEVDCPAGYKITMTPSVETITAGEEVQLQYKVEKDGEPVINLEPYLDAGIHFAILPASFETLLHHHGNPKDMDHHEGETNEGRGMGEGIEMENEHVTQVEQDTPGGMAETMDEDMKMEGMEHDSVPGAFGPELVSESLIFPKAGLYQVFAQVKHEGKIIFSNFMVEVEEGFDETTAKTIDLALKERTLTPTILTLEQGDKIILRVSGDEAGEFHISGYGIEKEIKVGGVIEIRFTANLAGRYNFELHPEGSEDDLEIGALVVNPR